MTNLLTRLKNTIQADLHEALDYKEGKNPVAVLNHYLRECEKEVEKVGKLVDRQQLLKEEFTKEQHASREMVQKRDHQVRVAEQAGETELASFALRELTYYIEREERLSLSIEEVKKQLLALEQKHGEMKHKLKDMYIKRLELMGRENVVRANRRADHVLSEKSNSTSGNRFDEMECYIDQLEKGLQHRYNEHTIDQRIAQLEKDLNEKQLQN
ncbi:PspA/IM30 family protein [Jeotgalibacillus soli]|uniref:Modulator protein n=1 Tax=Jeotgalibacillus soli TaxID=889306 RepID=A0A0C2S2M6_9BACL|nr:PspA/IM30 family protein [Jeotgalibacillus soli]KIL48279.1 modulator protein [Jeotgalibacillus soli]